MIFTPEHGNRPHSPTGTVFWSTSNRSILSQLCTILTIGKTNQKKRHKTLTSVLCDINRSKTSPQRGSKGAGAKSRQTPLQAVPMLSKETNQNGSKPGKFSSSSSLGLVQNETIPATNLTSALRFSTCLPR